MEAPRYEVTTFDVCTSGFERLRSPSEFILCAYPRQVWGWRALRAAWLDDLQSCERGEGFDYEAARRVILAYTAQLRESMKGRTLGRVLGGFSEGEEGCIAFLYIRDTRED